MVRCEIWGGLILFLWASFSCIGATSQDPEAPPTVQERMAEWTVHSQKTYKDPFNDVDVDVVFFNGGQSWRVPMFWRGGNSWTVRFTPPAPGMYSYHLDSSDKSNPDLNGHSGKIFISAYEGSNALFRHGMLRISANRRYFEHADRTPFYWLGDTWWAGLSDRLSWEDFKSLTEDRKTKGFTVVQIVAGLAPDAEELPPIDLGDRNEGGAVWDTDFKRINPRYFDYADRRIQYLLAEGIVPAIVGGWSHVLAKMGLTQMKRHWRYIIARYGAYPAFWIAGGEVFDPPPAIREKLKNRPLFALAYTPGWTEVVRYIGETDPYHHPLSVHEFVPPYDAAVQNETLTDFDLFQAGHFSWPSVATEVALLDTHYSRTRIRKPLIVGEIGYEDLGGTQLEDFQRTAFWLAMLNGAAGHTYGAVGTWMSYNSQMPIERMKFSFMTWREGMRLPGSYQIGLGSRLLREYPWWRFAPHPEWVAPRGTTLLEPRADLTGSEVDLLGAFEVPHPGTDGSSPLGEWKQHDGNLFLPYAAGVPRKIRLVYIPYFGFKNYDSPTILGLEKGVQYHSYYWDPSLGIKFDLGSVQRPVPGAVIVKGRFDRVGKWSAQHGAGRMHHGKLTAAGSLLETMQIAPETDLAVAVDAQGDSNAGIVLRFQDSENYLSAVYSAREESLYLLEHRTGKTSFVRLGATPIGSLGPRIHLEAEIRGKAAIVSLTDGRHTYTTPIVKVDLVGTGLVGVVHEDDGKIQEFDAFEVRHSPVLTENEPRQSRIYDGAGVYRGDLSSASGPEWRNYGLERQLLLDAYQPDRLPYCGDWLLVLEANPDARAPPVNVAVAKSP